jgi:methionyl-tRNA formyltransferase
VSNHLCFNLHPGYNPVNRGWYPQVFAILYDLPIGATFHIIDEELDNGDIIARRFVEKKEYDTSYTLYNRIIECEISLWEENILSVLEDNYKRRKPEDSGNLFLKRDFNTLLNLNLQNVGTLQDHITLLRALTFDGYKNAYYFDSEGVKVYVSISLSREK